MSNRPKKKYQVILAVPMYFEAVVTASSKEEARTMAWEVYDNGDHEFVDEGEARIEEVYCDE